MRASGWIWLGVWLAVAGLVQADEVRLRDGSILKGHIISENSEQVMVSVGGSTLTVHRSEVTTLHHTPTLPTSKASTNLVAPQGATAELSVGLERLALQHAVAMQTLHRMQTLLQTLNRLQQEIKQLEDQELTLTKQLSRPPGTHRSAVQTYNNTAAKLNGIRAQLLERYKKPQEQLSAIEQCRRELATYTAAVLDFGVQLQAKQALGTDTALATIEKRFGFFRSEIRQIQLPYAQNRNRVEVTARVNDSTDGQFIVDTGATTISISEALATKLNLQLGRKNIDVAMADGTTRKAQITLLNVVEIQGVRVDHVLALILPASPAPGVDGLLGMNFLMGFNVRLDPAANRMILNHFAPN